MRIRFFSTTAVIALVVPGPVLADGGLQAAQRSADMGTAAGFLADQASRKIHANWHNDAGPRGLAMALEAGQVWYSGKGKADRAASRSHLLGSSVWLSYSDGEAWTLNLTGTRFDGRTQFGASGGYEMSGYGLTVSGTRRYGDFVLGTHNSFIWLDFNPAVRPADAKTKSAGFVENIGIEAGYRFGGEDWSVVPSFGVQHDDVSMGRFTDPDALAAFSKGGYEGWKADAGLSVELGRLVVSAIEVRPTLDVRYERWFGAGHIKVTEEGSAVTSAAISGRNAVTVRSELDFSLSGAVHLHASYLYRWQRYAREQGVWLKLAIRGW